MQRPERFRGSHSDEADLILLWIAGIVLTLLLWHASLIATGLSEWPAAASPVSNAIAQHFGEGTWADVRERMLVWAHLLLVLGFLAYLPRSKHLHIMTAAINVWFGRTRARGRLEPLDFTVEDESAMRFGSNTIADMTWKQMVDTMSCTECGRCQDVCPAYATGKELSPKLLIMGLRDQLFAEGPNLLADPAGFQPSPLVPNAVSDEVVWDCVTCGACVRECPVAIEHVDHIVDLRRHLVMVEGRFPAEGETMLRDVERSQNPWGKPQSERADWTDGLDVRVLQPGEPPPEVLYWVGCAASFDERARVTAQSTAKLLRAAGVDFAILGPRESCTGDPARRMGNEYTYQAYAEQNVATLNEAGVTKIVASCPHCFNTIANEYPDFGGRYEVVHHTELLTELLEEGRLQPAPGTEEITYHDSCYLARHNDVLAAPREIVSRIGKPLEMARNGKRTFCCGAGGAHMWLEERGNQINEERAREAAETGASTLAVACPFCTVMLDDGVRQNGADLRVADVATLLAEALPERARRRPESAGATRRRAARRSGRRAPRSRRAARRAARPSGPRAARRGRPGTCSRRPSISAAPSGVRVTTTTRPSAALRSRRTSPAASSRSTIRVSVGCAKPSRSASSLIERGPSSSAASTLAMPRWRRPRACRQSRRPSWPLRCGSNRAISAIVASRAGASEIICLDYISSRMNPSRRGNPNFIFGALAVGCVHVRRLADDADPVASGHRGGRPLDAERRHGADDVVLGRGRGDGGHLRPARRHVRQAPGDRRRDGHVQRRSGRLRGCSDAAPHDRRPGPDGLRHGDLPPCVLAHPRRAAAEARRRGDRPDRRHDRARSRRRPVDGRADLGPHRLPGDLLGQLRHGPAVDRGLLLFVPESPVRTGGRIDVVGAVLLAVGLAAPLVAIAETPSWGWGGTRTIVLFAVGAVVLAIFTLVRAAARTRSSTSRPCSCRASG